MVSISLGTSGKLDKSGGTLTGPLILARDPQQPFEAATRQWVLANAGSGGAGGIPASTVTAKGDLLAATGAGAVTRLAAGTDGQVLSAASGQPTGLQWTALPAVPAPGASVIAETVYGQAQAVGTATTYAREDHTHGSAPLTSTAPATVLAIGQTAATGTAATPARADHVHPLAAAALPGNSAVGDSAALGAVSTFAASDHRHGREAFGSTTALTAFGTASSNGTSTSPARADHVHGAPSLPGATTLAAGIVTLDGTAADIAALGAQSAGAVGKAADAGHVHPTTGLILLSNAASTVQPGTAYGTAGATGTSANYAREDHQHGTVSLTSAAPATTLAIGQAAAVGTALAPARADHVHPLAAAAAPGASAVGDGAGIGTSTSFAAADHQHGREAFGAVTALTGFNTASANGTAATVSHSDHVHGAPALPAATTLVAGIVQLDGTATDIQALGTQAAGALGKAADAGHVHPTTGLVLASQLPLAVASGGTGASTAAGAVANLGAVASDWCDMIGVALLTADPRHSGVTYQQTPGDLVLCLCTPPKTKTVSNLALWVTAGGVTGSGVNGLALYTEAGVLIDQTADMTSAWSSAGMVDGALGGSRTVTAGVAYWLGFLTHFSGTSPHLAATGTAQTANFPIMNGHRTAIFKSGQSSFPSSFDPTTYTPNSGYFFLYGR